MNKRLKLPLASICFILLTAIFIGIPTTAVKASATIVDIRKTNEVYLIGDDQVALTVGKTKSKVNWSTDNRIVATVSKDGVIQDSIEYDTDEDCEGEFDYFTYINAKVDGKTYKCKVVRLDAEYIYPTPTSSKVVVGKDPVDLYIKTMDYTASDIRNLGITYKVKGNSSVTIDTSEDFTSENGGSFSNARIKATKPGKFKLSVYAHEQKICTISMEAVEVGAAQLDPVDAVKYNSFKGYSGEALMSLQWIRNFIDTNNLSSSSLTDREKITIIQDYLIRNVDHDVNNTAGYEGIMARILLNGYVMGADCDFYSETFSFLCNCIDIEVYYCAGSANPGDDWYGHAWNKVKSDGTWYYIDTYWDACLHNYDYFLSETLWPNHKITDYETYYVDHYSNEGEIPYWIALY